MIIENLHDMKLYDWEHLQNGDYLIKDVDFFVATKREFNGKMFNFSPKWISIALERALKKRKNGYMPQLHIRHNEEGEELKTPVAVGFFIPKRIKNTHFDGKMLPTVFGDLMVNPKMFIAIMKHRYPYLSVEIDSFSEPEFTSMAFLPPGEPPFFENHPLILNKKGSKQNLQFSRWYKPLEKGKREECFKIMCFRRQSFGVKPKKNFQIETVTPQVANNSVANSQRQDLFKGIFKALKGEKKREKMDSSNFSKMNFGAFDFIKDLFKKKPKTFFGLEKSDQEALKGATVEILEAITELRVSKNKIDRQFARRRLQQNTRFMISKLTELGISSSTAKSTVGRIIKDPRIFFKRKNFASISELEQRAKRGDEDAKRELSKAKRRQESAREQLKRLKSNHDALRGKISKLTDNLVLKLTPNVNFGEQDLEEEERKLRKSKDSLERSIIKGEIALAKKLLEKAESKLEQAKKERIKLWEKANSIAQKMEKLAMSEGIKIRAKKGIRNVPEITFKRKNFDSISELEQRAKRGDEDAKKQLATARRRQAGARENLKSLENKRNKLRVQIENLRKLGLKIKDEIKGFRQIAEETKEKILKEKDHTKRGLLGQQVITANRFAQDERNNLEKIKKERKTLWEQANSIAKKMRSIAEGEGVKLRTESVSNNVPKINFNSEERSLLSKPGSDPEVQKVRDEQLSALDRSMNFESDKEQIMIDLGELERDLKDYKSDRDAFTAQRVMLKIHNLKKAKVNIFKMLPANLAVVAKHVIRTNKMSFSKKMNFESDEQQHKRIMKNLNRSIKAMKAENKDITNRGKGTLRDEGLRLKKRLEVLESRILTNLDEQDRARNILRKRVSDKEYKRLLEENLASSKKEIKESEREIAGVAERMRLLRKAVKKQAEDARRAGKGRKTVGFRGDKKQFGGPGSGPQKGGRRKDPDIRKATRLNKAPGEKIEGTFVETIGKTISNIGNPLTLPGRLGIKIIDTLSKPFNPMDAPGEELLDFDRKSDLKKEIKRLKARINRSELDPLNPNPILGTQKRLALEQKLKLKQKELERLNFKKGESEMSDGIDQTKEDLNFDKQSLNDRGRKQKDRLLKARKKAKELKKKVDDLTSEIVDRRKKAKSDPKVLVEEKKKLAKKQKRIKELEEDLKNIRGTIKKLDPSGSSKIGFNDDEGEEEEEDFDFSGDEDLDEDEEMNFDDVDEVAKEISDLKSSLNFQDDEGEEDDFDFMDDEEEDDLNFDDSSGLEMSDSGKEVELEGMKGRLGVLRERRNKRKLNQSEKKEMKKIRETLEKNGVSFQKNDEDDDLDFMDDDEDEDLNFDDSLEDEDLDFDDGMDEEEEDLDFEDDEDNEEDDLNFMDDEGEGDESEKEGNAVLAKILESVQGIMPRLEALEKKMGVGDGNSSDNSGPQQFSRKQRDLEVQVDVLTREFHGLKKDGEKIKFQRELKKWEEKAIKELQGYGQEETVKKNIKFYFSAGKTAERKGNKKGVKESINRLIDLCKNGREPDPEILEGNFNGGSLNNVKMKFYRKYPNDKAKIDQLEKQYKELKKSGEWTFDEEDFYRTNLD